jgi:hypothetical protein
VNTLSWIADTLRYKSLTSIASYVRHYPWVARESRRLLDTIDHDAFAALRAKQHSPRFNTVYLDLPTTLRVAVYRFIALGIQDSKGPVSVLDIGTGPGVFPFVCTQHGHVAVGTDIDKTPYFNDLTALLKIDRRLWQVEPFSPAPAFGRSFDLITATNVGFNVIRRETAGRRIGDEWGIEEWDFFLTDLARRVASQSARIFVTINQMQRPGRDRAGDRRLLDYFASRGAMFPTRGHVYFPSLHRLRRQTEADSSGAPNRVPAAHRAAI